jgi:hypothetical protein
MRHSRPAVPTGVRRGEQRPGYARGGRCPEPDLAGGGEREPTIVRAPNTTLAALMPNAVARFAPGTRPRVGGRRTRAHDQMMEAWIKGGSLPPELATESTAGRARGDPSVGPAEVIEAPQPRDEARARLEGKTISASVGCRWPAAEASARRTRQVEAVRDGGPSDTRPNRRRSGGRLYSCCGCS